MTRPATCLRLDRRSLADALSDDSSAGGVASGKLSRSAYRGISAAQAECSVPSKAAKQTQASQQVTHTGRPHVFSLCRCSSCQSPEARLCLPSLALLMPIGKMHRRCFLQAAVCLLTVVNGAQSAASGNQSTSLRVGDYAAGLLSNGTALPLYTLLWRAIGSAFSSNTTAVNQTFAQNANTAFLQAPHTMAYTVVNIRNAAASNTTIKVNGAAGRWCFPCCFTYLSGNKYCRLHFTLCAVEQISDPSNAAYSSTDLLLRATFTQDSVWEDLSVTQQAYRQQISSNLQSYGWNMVSMMHHPFFCLCLLVISSTS